MNRIQYRGRWYTFPEAIEAGVVGPTRHKREGESEPKKKRPGKNLLLRIRRPRDE
ncbi:hypothetical protein [Kyrpidia tusciae]|uniref:Uncharacterized protein n=1 Tax=Kyrpidia tusciae (strain DSM 2912 / NBRC 15312 / T2) TaxID=562970 RepID=D5WVA7_KYRT2|nr:hypothetical protein [Kyrpidia tusciae]ADG05517.1 hypothetical protein Btus_0757 [Kyrpidia tusciae DSM 2912]MBE3551649.1 hypothetical protein [Kyrpidia tusciae]